MSRLDPKLAQTVELLRGYRQTLRSMLPTQDRNQQNLLLEFSGGLDLLHIIVQLMVVSSDNVAGSILQECNDLDPKHFRLGFVSSRLNRMDVFADSINVRVVEYLQRAHWFEKPGGALHTTPSRFRCDR